MNSFKCVCNCDSEPRFILNGLHDSTESTQLDKALDQLVDSAWGDEDEEADEILACFIGNLKKGNYTHSENDFEDVFSSNKGLSPNAILTSLTYDGGSCHCRQVSHRISIALNWGLAELHCRSQPNELRLLEVLELVEPFAGMSVNEKGWQSFLQQLWKFSIESGKRKLTAKMVSIYPDEINRLLEKVLSSDVIDGESFLDNSDFNSIISIITLPEVFRHVSLYLAQRNSVCSVQVQILLNAILKALKSSLPKSRLLALYSDKLSSIAVILHETINPDDPLVANLLDRVKEECCLDFLILVTHFPIFSHMK
ncbi:uncharacterized protein LOC135715502 [Ochlerotatus camptorhynchus]|uniref:uncharacterized protein LOC135715033 n=1 Tax=Ochlerotatus camptorhynchus TaxID=644619 RepID=UPI0031DD93D1